MTVEQVRGAPGFLRPPGDTFEEQLANAQAAFGDRLWRDVSYGLGHEVWAHTYKQKPDDDGHALRTILNIEAANGRVARVVETSEGLGAEDTRSTMFLLGMARWVDGGCRILTTDAKYFAAMAHTKIGRDAAEDLRIPWPSFMIEWPGDLCVAPDGFVYDSALFTQVTGIDWILPTGERRTTASVMVINNKRAFAGPSLHRVWPGTLAEMLFQDDLPDRVHDSLDMSRTDGDAQIQEMVARAAAGLLYTIQHTNNWRPSKFPSPVRRGKLRSSPPPHRVISIGRPLSVDVTSAVRDRAAGRAHAAPSVQTLVRGHVKRQVVGLGRRGRKVIWVEPYWRGPEDAPILARPYRVGPSDALGGGSERSSHHQPIADQEKRGT